MLTTPMRICSALLLVAVACGLACPNGGYENPTAEPYLADLAQLENLVATTYANFEWALTEGGIDPVALHARTHREIQEARSDDEARQALKRFVESFRDGHFRLREARGEVSDGDAGKNGPGPETPGPLACEELGYEEHDQSLRLDFGDQFRPATDPDDPFPAGWLARSDGSRIGLVRIDEFGAERYGEYCPQTWESYRKTLEQADRLLDEIAQRIRVLESHDVAGLIVDITGNGGGSDWVDPTARMLTDKQLLGNGRSFVRHAHWRGILEEMAGEVAGDLGRDDLSLEQRAVLEEVEARLRTGIAETRRSCDLSAVWGRGTAKLPCSLLVRDTLFTTGLLAAPPAIETDGLMIGSALFKALEYGVRPTAWRGPLAVLIDRDTASAAELFVALLCDNDAAMLVGEQTFGVGCGYTNGGIQTILEHSRFEVWLPDCIRHRRDGGNERAGIAPDLQIDLQGAAGAEKRGSMLLERLSAWP
ncbi:MAG: S41 family peptidase [Planctomycetota bacterium]|jgi:hypothetical protein